MNSSSGYMIVPPASVDNGSSSSSGNNRRRLCPSCKGGCICSVCGGKGEYWIETGMFTGRDTKKLITCSTCKGTKHCGVCRGNGYINFWRLVSISNHFFLTINNAFKQPADYRLAAFLIVIQISKLRLGVMMNRRKSQIDWAFSREDSVLIHFPYSLCAMLFFIFRMLLQQVAMPLAHALPHVAVVDKNCHNGFCGQHAWPIGLCRSDEADGYLHEGRKQQADAARENPQTVVP